MLDTTQSQEPTQASPAKVEAPCPRLNYLVTITWLFIGLYGALLSPWLGLAPPWINSLAHLCLPSLTIAIILWNFLTAVRLISATDRTMAAFPLTLLQMLLFTLAFYQIANHFGLHHYRCRFTPMPWHWIGYAAAHAVRAGDLPDAIHAAGWRLQSIHCASHASALMQIFYHFVMDVFFFSLILEGLAKLRTAAPRWSRHLAARWPSVRATGRFLVWVLVVATFLFCLPLALVVTLVAYRKQKFRAADVVSHVKFVCGVLFCFLLLIVVAASFRQFQGADRFLVPLDNCLRTFDFADVMQAYQLKLHGVSKDVAGYTFINLVFRVFFFVVLLRVARRVRDGVKALILRRVDGLSSSSPVSRSKLTVGAFRGAAAKAVVGGLAGAFLVCWIPSPIGRLTGRACGDNDRAARQAIEALRRMGPRASDALQSLTVDLASLPLQRQLAVVDLLAYIGPQSAPLLRDIVRRQGEAQVAARAVESMHRLGAETAPLLLLVMPHVQADSLRTLIRQRLDAWGDEGLDYLVEAVTPENAEQVLSYLRARDSQWHERRSSSATFNTIALQRQLELEHERSRSGESSPYPDYARLAEDMRRAEDLRRLADEAAASAATVTQPPAWDLDRLLQFEQEFQRQQETRRQSEALLRRLELDAGQLKKTPRLPTLAPPRTDSAEASATDQRVTR